MFAVTLPAEQSAGRLAPVRAGAHRRVALQVEKMELVEDGSHVCTVATAVEGYGFLLCHRLEGKA